MSSSGSGDITVGVSTKLSTGAGDGVDHSRVCPSHGSSSAGAPDRRVFAAKATKPSSDDAHQAVTDGHQHVPQLGRPAVVVDRRGGRLIGEPGDVVRERGEDGGEEAEHRQPDAPALSGIIRPVSFGAQ